MKHLLFCLLMIVLVLEAKAQTVSIVGTNYSNSCSRGANKGFDPNRPIAGKNDKPPANNTQPPLPKEICYQSYGVLLKIPQAAFATFTADRLWVNGKYLFVLDQASVSVNGITDENVFFWVSGGTKNKNKTKSYTKPPIAYKGAGLLRCKINGKTQYLKITEFESHPPG